MNTLQLSLSFILTIFIILTNGSDDGQCCAPKKMTTKNIANCPTLTDEATCISKKGGNKCRWIDCEDVGYCEWNEQKVGKSGNIEKLCLRQPNIPKCINKVFAGSKACRWVSGTPPHHIIAIMDEMTLDDDQNEDKDEEEFVVISEGTSNIGANIDLELIGLIILICFICSWSVYCTKSWCKNDDNISKEHKPLLLSEKV